MSEIKPSDHLVPCMDIERVQMIGERRTMDKNAEQSAFTTFNNWARHEARRMCKRGS